MAGPEVDMMSLFKRMYGGGAAAAMQPRMGQTSQQPQVEGGEPGSGFPSIDPAMMFAQGAAGAGMGDGAQSFAPMPTTASGYVPGAPIIATPSLHEGLTRLQAGQVNFEVDGASVGFSGIPQGLHNVLRDLQQSPLGHKANQLESMTIEMVAMLFDFIFDTRDMPDGIKALLARLQIPVLKAAMLDGAFFAKKTHPARLLVNALAQAGLAWSPVTGNEDPLYRKIDQIVHRVLDGFDNDLSVFDELRHDLEEFLAAEEAAAEANIASSAEEINQRDRLEPRDGHRRRGRQRSRFIQVHAAIRENRIWEAVAVQVVDQQQLRGGRHHARIGAQREVRIRIVQPRVTRRAAGHQVEVIVVIEVDQAG